MKHVIALIILATSLCASCSLGPSLKTLSASGNLLQANIGMNIQIPRGSLTVIADGSVGSTEVTAVLDVYNRGLSGLTFDPASIDDIGLELRTEGEVQVVLGEEAEKPNFSYALEVHVPSDYQFWSANAQEPNNIEIGEGEIYVKGLKGAEMGHRDFQFWAGDPLDGFSHPKMTIEDIDGIVTAAAWGPMKISGCRAISLAMGGGSGDALDLSLGTIAISEQAKISAAGNITIRLDPDSNFTFYNQIDHAGIFNIGSVKNSDSATISGPEDIDVHGIVFEAITIGSGEVGNFDVFTIDRDITYRLK